MQRSEQIDQLCAALVAAQAELHNPPKNREVEVTSKSGRSYAFKYATLDSILDQVRPILQKNGLSLIQMFCTVGDREGLRTMLLHTSGQFIADESRFYAVTMAGQDFGIVVSYQRRYAVMSILGLAGEDDRDGETSGRDNRAPRGSARGAMQEVFDALDSTEQEKVRSRANSLQDMHKRNGIIAVVDELHAMNLDQDGKMALWYLLPSRIRSDIKNEEEHRRLIAREAKQGQGNGADLSEKDARRAAVRAAA